MIEKTWIIKGFINVYRRISTISVDTKIVSKALEILLLPSFAEFAARHEMKLVCRHPRTSLPICLLLTCRRVADSRLILPVNWNLKDDDELFHTDLQTGEGKGKLLCSLHDWIDGFTPDFRPRATGAGGALLLGVSLEMDAFGRQNFVCHSRRGSSADAA